MSKFIRLHTKDNDDLISFNTERIDCVMSICKSTEDGGIDSYSRVVCNGLMTDVVEDYISVIERINNNG